MTFLPIVERELRVAARRPATYWSRLLVALVATIIGSSILIAEEGSSAAQLGTYIFQGLAGLSLLYCLISGRRTTADCLSEEKREGTLGLLFLTDLKGYDIVLGKLTATSLNAFYGLLAVFPVLALPLFIGGVTNGEFWRMALVLMDTFIFSLAIGIFASSLTRESRNAFAANFLLLLGLVLLLPACAAGIVYFVPSHPLVHELFYTCPGYSFYYSFDAPYKTGPDHFWWSLGVIHALSWLLVILTGRIVPRSWQDQPARPGQKAGWAELWHAWSFGKVEKRAPFRRQLLDRNAFCWLAGRARLKPAHVWTFLAVMAVWWLLGWLVEGGIWLDDATGIAMSVILNSALKMWVTIEAGQRLAEDQRNGALELLLTTPLTGRDIVRGQMLALRRQFLGPLLAVLGLEFVFMLGWLGPSFRNDPAIRYTYLAGMIMLVADVIALSWVALAAALTAKSHTYATMIAAARILILPWSGLTVLFGAVNLWALLWGATAPPEWGFYVFWWFVFGLIADVAFGVLAWRRLRNQFYALATRRFAPKVPAAALRRAHAAAGETVTAPRRRLAWRTGIVSAGILIAGIVWFAFRSPTTNAFPPPVIITLGPGNAPLKVFSVLDGACLILPDGSLWQWGCTRGRQFPRIATPERMGGDNDWVAVGATVNYSIGVLRDGTLREWEKPGPILPNGLRAWIELRNKLPVGSDSDWVNVSCGLDFSVALKRDGTLWAWGNNAYNQLGNGVDGHAAGFNGMATPELAEGGVRRMEAPWQRRYGTRPGEPPPVMPPPVVPPSATTRPITPSPVALPSTAPVMSAPPAHPVGNFPVQVGTGSNWSAVACGQQYSLALRKDGTLWAWGQIPWFPGRQPPINLAVPTQICAETNWVELTTSRQPWARMENGSLWMTLHSTPDPNAPASFNCRMLTANVASNQFAFAFCGQPNLYAIRANGTLWEASFADGLGASGLATGWRQVGQRKDWLSLWGTGRTAFGLTADGTLWTWGVDLGREPAPDFSSRARLLNARIQAVFGSRTRTIPTGRTPQPIQKEPRPLLRMEGDK